MNHETAYLEIKKLTPTAADIIFLRAATGSIDQRSTRRLRETLGAEGFEGFLIVGTNDVSMECLDEEMMREHGWVRANE
jgi:hypothetical protein